MGGGEESRVGSEDGEDAEGEGGDPACEVPVADGAQCHERGGFGPRRRILMAQEATRAEARGRQGSAPSTPLGKDAWLLQLLAAAAVP